MPIKKLLRIDARRVRQSISIERAPIPDRYSETEPRPVVEAAPRPKLVEIALR